MREGFDRRGRERATDGAKREIAGKTGRVRMVREAWSGG